MSPIYPKLPPREISSCLTSAALGALVAGVYGIVHDQITYTLSPEYFTKFKFGQFAWADLGFPVRVFVAEIGFLATWWVGFIAGWFLGRVALKHGSHRQRRVATGIAWIIGFAISGAVLGALCHMTFPDGPKAWADGIDLEETRRFLLVGWIHTGGYAGALIGLVFALWRNRSHGLQSVMPLRRTD
ncbi:MAG: hypothetical protein H7A49_00645 [Akkermansiaceae bacterium]|nr:hypothetical protein [Akkermansiaceae bacterium]MCP5542390.1 hypothetical protein [Akkermansiaceae bacterium]